MQVSALSAVMELVRAARGAERGAFDVELFRRALSAALGPFGSGELVGVLTSKYMAFADVRWAFHVCSCRDLGRLKPQSSRAACNPSVKMVCSHTKIATYNSLLYM